MRILDEDHDRRLAKVCLYLSPQEAGQLISYLGNMLANPSNHHCHLEDHDLVREITVTVYREDNLHTYDKRSRQLIEEDR